MTQNINCIFENSSISETSNNQGTPEDGVNRFDDSLDHFIKILKKTTSAVGINIYSKDLVQIFQDYEFSFSLVQNINALNLLREMQLEAASLAST